jgi:CDP-glycerol glycerophosphotransferase (TagB/SpsB family)
MLGFSRFDALHNVDRDENLILVMPTWRNWLGRESQENKGLDFVDTEYCKQWTAFLQDERLAALLEKYDKKLLFYPHRNMQKFLGHFTSNSERIEIADWKEYDIQEVLKKAALMITDYSSVFFDFSYMRKPVIFYQFDEKEFREKQYEEGYFNYHDTVLGEWSGELSSVLSLLEKQLEKGMTMHSEETVRQFFPLLDTNNSERIYNMIKNGD